MAAPFNEGVKGVLVKIEIEIKKELGIINGPICRAVHDNLKSAELENQIIGGYVEVYGSVVNEKSRNIFGSGSIWTIKYFNECCNFNKNLLDFLLKARRPVAENVNQRNIIVLLNFYAPITLLLLRKTRKINFTKHNDSESVERVTE